MEQTYRYRPLPVDKSGLHTRVLVLQPSLHYDAPLACILREVSLADKRCPRYMALSYVWGAKHGDRPITCEGKTILITKNCDEALRSLRRRWRRIVIWVDAICIDQSDNKDKSRQVPMMGDIYSHAKEVVIWLGKSDYKINRLAVWVYSHLTSLYLKFFYQSKWLNFVGLYTTSLGDCLRSEHVFLRLFPDPLRRR